MKTITMILCSIRDFVRRHWIAISLCVLAFVIPRYVILIGYVPTSSMEDTIPTGSFYVASRLEDDLERGDIAVFRMNDSFLVKRVIAVEDDTILLSESDVFINGSKIQEDYIKGKALYENAEIDIKEDMYFFMGDNRSNSVDSRDFGCVSKEDIEGRFLFIIPSII